MPRFADSMERVRRETRTVIVEADGEQPATAIAVANDFDEDKLDDWDPLDPGDPLVYDQPLKPASPDREETISA